MNFSRDMNVSRLVAHAYEYKKTKAVHVSKEHVHTLTLRVFGTKVITPEGAPKPLVSDAGSITYIPSGVAYSEAAHDDGLAYSIHFELYEDCDCSAFVYKPASSIEYANLFRVLCEGYRAGYERDYRCLSLFYAILAQLSSDLSRTERHAVPKRIRHAINVINRLYSEPDLAVSELAAEANVSDVYFRREFRACVGMSPIEYITKVRLENAKALLDTGVYQVSEVATRCGFDSISYFSQRFKKAYGLSPSEYMKRQE